MNIEAENSGNPPDPPNPLDPLPADYYGLTPAGQRKARVAAVSKHDTPQEFLKAWVLFRELYLLPSGYDFYDDGIVDSPAPHYEWINDYASYQLNVMGAPRNSGKSQVVGRELPLMLALTKPYHRVLLMNANYTLTQHRMAELQHQLTTNERILEDFGKQQPAGRSGDLWNLSIMTLAERRSGIQGVSVDSRKRGPRPHTIIMDDVEYDPHNDVTNTDLLDNLDTILFKQLFNMLGASGRLFWIGTLLTRRSAIYHALNSDDPRFRYWNRRTYKMVNRNSGGTLSYFWPERFSPEYIRRRRLELGASAFEAELQNNPIAQTERALSLKQPFDYYYITEAGRVRWYGEGDEKDPSKPVAGESAEPFEQWADKMPKLFVVDPATGASATSDYGAVLVVGQSDDGFWWLLDAYVGRAGKQKLIDKIYELGVKWQPCFVAVESIGMQTAFKSDLATQSLARAQGQPWQPRILPVKYPSKMDKGERIQALSSRFARHQIKLPYNQRHQWPWTELIKEIQDFTPDLSLLPHDDAVDALGMVQFVPKARRLQRKTQRKGPPDIEEQLRQGRLYEETTGLPLSRFISPGITPPELIEAYTQAVYARQHGDNQAAEARKGSTRRRLLGGSFRGRNPNRPPKNSDSFGIIPPRPGDST